jgi:O-antigen ligase
VIGAGWQASLEPAAYERYLADARRRFPAQPAQAFPSPATPTNPQNVYLQLLSDLGLLGLLAFLATAAGAACLAVGALRARGTAAEVGAVALLFLLVALGVGNAIGLVAGIPLDALLWIGVGASLAAASLAERHV